MIDLAPNLAIKPLWDSACPSKQKHGSSLCPLVPLTQCGLNRLGNGGNRGEKKEWLYTFKLGKSHPAHLPKASWRWAEKGGLAELGAQGHQAVQLRGPQVVPPSPPSPQTLSGVSWPMSSQWGQQGGAPWISELPNSSLELCGPPSGGLRSALFQTVGSLGTVSIWALRA